MSYCSSDHLGYDGSDSDENDYEWVVGAYDDYPVSDLARSAFRASNDKVQHALNLLSSLRMMKDLHSYCDFNVKVGTKLFPAHRNILASCSDFFRVMFSNDVKEVQEGVVNLMDVKADAVKICMDFMYTGELDLHSENFRSIFLTADFLQMQGLTDCCLGRLHNVLTFENCVEYMYWAREYNFVEVESGAKRFMTTNLREVSETAVYTQLSFKDVSDVVKEHGLEVCWKAMLKWVKVDVEIRERHFTDFMMSRGMNKFMFDFLVETVWNEPLIQKNELLKSQVIVSVFSRVRNSRWMVNVQNVFALRDLMRNCMEKYPSDLENVTIEVISKNLAHACEKEGFKRLTKEEILSIYSFGPKRSGGWCNAKTRWDAAVKWVEHELGRGKFLPELSKHLDLDKMSKMSLTQILNDPPVKGSREYEDIVKRAILVKEGKGPRNCGGERRNNNRRRNARNPY